MRRPLAILGLSLLAVASLAATAAAAGRRRLGKTMAQARSMGEVVQASAIPLIENSDDAVVWGGGARAADGGRARPGAHRRGRARGPATGGYMPLWYGSGHGSGGDGGTGGWAPGVMSSTPIPSFGGMMAALGTIGNSASSSGGGGFGGGGAGGGGGGAGGGF